MLQCFMCVLEVTFAVNREEDVELHVCIRGDSHCAEPVPEELAHSSEAILGSHVTEHGPRSGGAYVVVEEERGKSCW